MYVFVLNLKDFAFPLRHIDLSMRARREIAAEFGTRAAF